VATAHRCDWLHIVDAMLAGSLNKTASEAKWNVASTASVAGFVLAGTAVLAIIIFVIALFRSGSLHAVTIAEWVAVIAILGAFGAMGIIHGWRLDVNASHNVLIMGSTTKIAAAS